MADSAPTAAFTRLEAEARSHGFDWFGTAPAAALHEELARLRDWLAAGRHGTMEWLARHPERRSNPALVVEGCQTVIVLGMNYLREPVPDPRGAPVAPPAGMGRISRYARTRDYHRVIEKRLRKLARFIDTELAPGATTRGYVDYGPVLERPWAAAAGLGFIGKNTLLIHPRHGSFHFLAVLLSTARIDSPARAAVTEGCGNCRRCIDACPTGAITEPWKLDARRCLSYLTIEHEGPVPEELEDRFGGWLVGCDICQDVCPYNVARAEPAASEELGPELVPATVRLADLLRDAEGFLAAIPAASPLGRVGASKLRRNAVLSAGDTETEALSAIASDETQPADLRHLAQRKLQRKK